MANLNASPLGGSDADSMRRVIDVLHDEAIDRAGNPLASLWGRLAIELEAQRPQPVTREES